MKYILTEEHIDIPDGVTITAKRKEVEVKGPLGTLKKAFKHVPISIQLQQKENKQKKLKRRVTLQMWNAYRKQKSQVTTVSSHISNMIRGVTKGYKYKMVLAYAHFPIIVNLFTGKRSAGEESKGGATIQNQGNGIEIKNFLGEKIVRTINCLEGVTISRKEEEKNVLTLVGTSLENLSLTCALIHQSVLVKEKDIRQFLDGIYVSEKRLEMKE